MTATFAARELDAIRNNRSDSASDLIARVDAVGQWAAAQKKNSKATDKILAEASDLHARLTGGTRSGKTTIVLS
jgi:hypothetical protein